MQSHKLWLLFARDDLTLAKLSYTHEEAILAAIFHTQQCAEKALKAFLAFKKQPFRKIHDLVALLEMCSKFDNAFNEFFTEVEDLNPYLTQSRYPDDICIFPDLTTLEFSIKNAEKILFFVEEKIKSNLT